jgi:hypothetical protein
VGRGDVVWLDAHENRTYIKASGCVRDARCAPILSQTLTLNRMVPDPQLVYGWSQTVVKRQTGRCSSPHRYEIRRRVATVTIEHNLRTLRFCQLVGHTKAGLIIWETQVGTHLGRTIDDKERARRDKSVRIHGSPQSRAIPVGGHLTILPALLGFLHL